MQSRKTGLKMTGDPLVDDKIKTFVADLNLPHFNPEFTELVASLFRLAQQDLTTGDMRLIQRSLGELRYAQKVFSPYRGKRKICIFGSARTQPTAPTYQNAFQYARLMQEAGYMVITGAGEGIMGAAQRGAGRENSFGLNIMLPFEQHPNEEIKDDPKLVTFRYFFTRKLTFLREASAVALFPGGFGTLDEGFEALTLLQTGKARLFPVVLIDAPGGKFWASFIEYLRGHLLKNKLVSEQDFNLFRITTSLEEARQEVLGFYKVFHSYRFVGHSLVMRLTRPLPAKTIEILREDFAHILGPKKELRACEAFPQESDEPDLLQLPRLILSFDGMQYGFLRELINTINASEI